MQISLAKESWKAWCLNCSRFFLLIFYVHSLSNRFIPDAFAGLEVGVHVLLRARLNDLHPLHSAMEKTQQPVNHGWTSRKAETEKQRRRRRRYNGKNKPRNEQWTQTLFKKCFSIHHPSPTNSNRVNHIDRRNIVQKNCQKRISRKTVTIQKRQRRPGYWPFSLNCSTLYFIIWCCPWLIDWSLCQFPQIKQSTDQQYALKVSSRYYDWRFDWLIH